MRACVRVRACVRASVRLCARVGAGTAERDALHVNCQFLRLAGAEGERAPAPPPRAGEPCTRRAVPTFRVVLYI